MVLIEVIVSFVLPVGVSLAVEVVRKITEYKEYKKKIEIAVDDIHLEGYDTETIQEMLKKVQDGKQSDLPPHLEPPEEPPTEPQPKKSEYKDDKDMLLDEIRRIVKEELLVYEKRNEPKNRRSTTIAFIAGATASFVISLFFYVLPS